MRCVASLVTWSLYEMPSMPSRRSTDPEQAKGRPTTLQPKPTDPSATICWPVIGEKVVKVWQVQKEYIHSPLAIPTWSSYVHPACCKIYIHGACLHSISSQHRNLHQPLLIMISRIYFISTRKWRKDLENSNLPSPHPPSPSQKYPLYCIS